MIMGYRFESVGGAVAAIVFATGIGFGFSWLGAAIAAKVRQPDMVGMLSMFWLFPLMLASTAFTPAESMPGWLQPFATYQPISVAADAVRGLCEGSATLLSWPSPPDGGSVCSPSSLHCRSVSTGRTTDGRKRQGAHHERHPDPDRGARTERRVTMVEVAKTAGVARATLYNHYPDVPTILTEAATVHNAHAIAGLRQALSIVASPPAAMEQIARYIASISTHGHTMQTHHGLPPGLRAQLDAFDAELEARIRGTLADGIAVGDFRADLDLDTTTTLIRHALNGISELVATDPDHAADIVSNTLPTVLAALANRNYEERT